MTLHPAFTGNPLNRDDRFRADPNILALAFREPSARFLVMQGDRILTGPAGDIEWVDPKALGEDAVSCMVFLGLDGGENSAEKRYGVQIIKEIEGFGEKEAAGIKYRDARSIGMKLGGGAPSLGIVAQAKSMLDWHHRHQYCANCGAETQVSKGGYQRDCMACGAHHFPRTDPVVIMLVECGEKILLGRGPKLPPGFYSALAGFVEPGESLEEAVKRELEEEAGVKAHSIRYMTSQPWPWPSSLMIGCMASADDFDCVPDGEEVDSLLWLSRSDLKEIIAGRNPSVAVPPPIAIARTLIDHWIATKP